MFIRHMSKNIFNLTLLAIPVLIITDLSVIDISNGLPQVNL